MLNKLTETDFILEYLDKNKLKVDSINFDNENTLKNSLSINQ